MERTQLNPFLFYPTVSRLFSPFYHFTDGRTPWTSDWIAARPLLKHRTTHTQNKQIHIPNIHALCGIRTHDPSFRAREDSTCLRPPGYRDLPWERIAVKKMAVAHLFVGPEDSLTYSLVPVVKHWLQCMWLCSFFFEMRFNFILQSTSNRPNLSILLRFSVWSPSQLSSMRAIFPARPFIFVINTLEISGREKILKLLNTQHPTT
jgi:hypothetical protein